MKDEAISFFFPFGAGEQLDPICVLKRSPWWLCYNGAQIAEESRQVDHEQAVELLHSGGKLVAADSDSDVRGVKN